MRWHNAKTERHHTNMRALYIDEIQALLDIAREQGFEGTYDEFKYILYNDPDTLRRIMPERSMGSDFRDGGLATLFRRRGMNDIIRA